MKKTFRLFAFAAAAVAMLSSCAKEAVVSNGEDTGMTFTVTAEYTEPVADAKTAFVDGETPYVKWLSTDQIRVYEFIDGEQNAYFKTAENGTHLSADSKKATFDVVLFGDDKEGATSYCYTAIYPATGVQKSNSFYYFEIPASQTLSEGGNFAEGSDVLIGKPVTMTSRISETENLEVQFKRPGTIVALTLKGITAGEAISSVKITAPEGQKIAGRCKVNLQTGEVPEADKAYYGGTNEITLNCGITATGDDKFYFRCLDGTWASGSEVSIAVETDAATYSKTVNLPKDYVFADGGLTRFGFQGMTREQKEVPTTYTLVKSGDKIFDGATYIVVSRYIASDNSYYTIKDLNSSGYYNSCKICTKGTTSDSVLESIDVASTLSISAFKISEINANNYTLLNTTSNKYFSTDANSTSGIKEVETVNSDKEKYTITIDATTGIVTIKSIASGITRGLFGNIQSSRFGLYASDQQKCTTYLYVDESTCKEKVATPVLGTPTVNHFTKSITITWTDVANATVYEVSCGEQKQNVNPGVQTYTFNGLSAGDYTITVKAVDGTGTYTPATATTDKITLGDPTITLSTTEVANVAAEGGDFDDITYELSYAEDNDLSWTCDETVVTEVVADGGEIVYSVSENAAAEGRNGWIKVTLNDETQTITISQLGKGAAPDPVLTKLKDITDVPATGVTGVTASGVYSLENAEFGDLTITPDGVIVTAASSNTLGSITYTVAANTGVARTGSITINIDGAGSIEISVSQLTGISHDYKLVESSLTDWRGDYLIAYSDDVFMDGSLAGGKDGVGKAQSHVAPGDNLSADKKTVLESWGDAHYVTIEAINDADLTKGYVIKSHSSTTPYFYQSSNKNGMECTATKTTAAKYPITIEFTSSSDIKLKLGGVASGAVLRYNNTAGSSGEMFRYYKNGGQSAIYLYKKQ